MAEPTDDTGAAIETVASWLGAAGRVVALTGAGISTESGIPDFRGPQGVWTRDPSAERMATIDVYLAEPAVRERAWRMRLDSPMREAEPNDAHRALVTLERSDALHVLVTQNVDGLHHAAGQDPERVIEIHGNVRQAKCTTCDWRGPMADTLARVAAGEADPPCTACGGILKSATISFGESLVVADLERATRAAETADVFLALGTSLGVSPAAALPEIALRAGARLVIVNGEPTPFDTVADVVLRDRLGEVLPALAARI